jgi:hypothetical protein
MPGFFYVALGLFLAWVALIAIVLTIAVKSGKLKLKKGGAPGIDRGSGGSDSSMQL